MAIPIWVPIALAVASAGANTMAQRKIDKASAQAYKWVEANNDKNIDKAKAAALKTENLYKDQQAKEAAEAQRLSNVFTETKPVEQALSAVGNAGATDVIVAENNRQKASAKRYTDMVGDARANLLAGGYVLGSNARESMDNAIDIKRAMDFMKGDNAVFNTKLQNAQTKGKAWGTAGDLLSMASMLTGMGAMMAPAGAAGAAGGAKGATIGASSVGSNSSIALNPLTKLPYPPML